MTLRVICYVFAAEPMGEREVKWLREVRECM